MSAHPLQRVVQVCFGCEHGVLVTDAGIPFTFGDNRYGQLGRSACKLSESGEPFPVLDLKDHEIVQVAAGTHHCLALSASRLVWAWGRNKVGQLGCGDTHDRIRPTKVSDPRPGAGQLGNIITVSAGGNSSVAASLGSGVWQWGEVSRDFAHAPKDVKDPGAPPAAKQKSVPVENKLPFCVFREDDIKRRKAPVASVSESGFRVLGGLKPFEKEQVRDLIKSARKWQRSITEARSTLKKELPPESREAQAGSEAAKSTAHPNEVYDACGRMQRELKMIDREIYLLERNRESCELQQKHLRDEIAGLAGRGVRLSAKENQISMSLVENRGGERNLDKEMAEIKALLEANHSTRTTLLEQRTQTDKEKQHVDDQLKEKRRLRDEQQKQLLRIQDVQRAVDPSSRTNKVTDSAREVLRDMETLARVDAHGPEDFQSAMAALEAEGKQLSAVEERLRGLAGGHSDPGRVESARLMVDLLQSLVDLHRQRNGLLVDGWTSSDLDLSGLFGQAALPRPPRPAEPAAGGPPSRAGLWALPSS